MELIVVAIILFSLWIFFTIKKAKETPKKFGSEKFLFAGEFIFVDGLNLPQNVKCKITCLNDKLVFTANGQQMILNGEKLANVSMMSKSEIQNHYVSSVGGAIAGGLLFGPLGAIIGGRAKQKTSNINNYFLIFSYWKEDDEMKYIVFDVTNSKSEARHFERFFSRLNQQNPIETIL